ncbi:MAG: valine--tRNA ligase [Firmicutes bacterium]|nr:valine--tRNA ligase [Bacillota bacterium]
MEQRYNFKTAEKKQQDLWARASLGKKKDGGQNTFKVDTPPPTVSGTIHLGHVFGYTQADIVTRYRKLIGQDIFYGFGFDNNGLATELFVEKQNKVRARDFSRKDFLKLAEDTVEKFNNIYMDTYIASGISADFTDPYSTVSMETQAYSQESFLELVKAGDIYHGARAGSWCVSCQTSIAQAELDDKEQTTQFYYMKWYVVDKDKVGSQKDEKYGRIEIATTRPELLHGCVAVLVHPKDKRFKNFVGKEAFVPLFEYPVPIMADENVAMDKGTGAVMVCTYGDNTDVDWAKTHKLPYREALESWGKLSPLAGKYAGLSIKDAKEAIVADLKGIGAIYKEEERTQVIKTHERCGVKAEILPKPQWFVETSKYKKELMAQGEKIQWHPERFKKTYLDWVENLNQDWCISRQRGYGIPIPAFYCKDCEEIIFPEVKDLPIDPTTSKLLKTLKCKCGGGVRGETDTFDTWFTSAISPQIASGYTGAKLPFSIRFHAREIIRTWDFYAITKCYLHHMNHKKTGGSVKFVNPENKSMLPWTDLLISGWVVAGDGEKMSKSKDNAKTSLLGVLENYGADAIRYWAANGVSLGSDIMVSEDSFKQASKVQNKLYNAVKFCMQFLAEDDKPKEVRTWPFDYHYMSELFKMSTGEFHRHMEAFEVGKAQEILKNNFMEFCDYYLEIAKNRLYKPEIYGQSGKDSAKIVLGIMIMEYLKLFSVFMPHICEDIFQQIKAPLKIKAKTIAELKVKKLEIFNDVPACKEIEEAKQVIETVWKYKSLMNWSHKDTLKSVHFTSALKEWWDEKTIMDIKGMLGIEEFHLLAGKRTKILIK